MLSRFISNHCNLGMLDCQTKLNLYLTFLEAEHGYAVSLLPSFTSCYGGGIENSAPSDDHVVPTANNCRGGTGPATMMIPINSKGTGGGSNALAFNGKFNQTSTNNSHRILGKHVS